LNREAWPAVLEPPLYVELKGVAAVLEPPLYVESFSGQTN
jgi:hypothetical protein